MKTQTRTWVAIGRAPRAATPCRARNRSIADARRPHRLSSRNTSGFTLLEMLAVIILIGIALTALAISTTRGLTSAKIRAASTDLAAALRYTRAQAIVHAKPEVLLLDIKARTYQPPGKQPRSLPDDMHMSVTSAAGDQSDGHIARIRFFPDGSSTGGHVVLRRGARQWRINVAWLTGVISIHDGKQESGS